MQGPLCPDSCPRALNVSPFPTGKICPGSHFIKSLGFTVQDTAEEDKAGQLKNWWSHMKSPDKRHWGHLLSLNIYDDIAEHKWFQTNEAIRTLCLFPTFHAPSTNSWILLSLYKKDKHQLQWENLCLSPSAICAFMACHLLENESLKSDQSNYCLLQSQICGIREKLGFECHPQWV